MQRTHLHAFLEAVADGPLLLRAVGDLCHELLGDRFEEVHALHREAGLPRVEEASDRGRGGRAPDIGVVADDHGIAASELQGHPRHVLGCELHDPLARLRLAGERDLVHLWMRDERVADLSAGSVHGIQDACGNSDRVDDLDRPLRRERGGRCRLEHDGAAGRERGAHLVGHEREREVPRRDRDHDADRSAKRESELVLILERDVIAAELVREAREEVEVLGHPSGLDHRVRERLALLERQQLRDLGHSRLHLHRGGVHQRRPLRAGHGRPRR